MVISSLKDYCEPIVDMKTWDTVQKIVEEYAWARTTERHPRRANSIYLFSGLVYCGQCGAPLYGNTVTRNNIYGRDEAYRCSQARRRRDCSAGRISRRRLEEAVLSTIRSYVLLPEAVIATQQVAIQSYSRFEAERTSRRSTLILNVESSPSDCLITGGGGGGAVSRASVNVYVFVPSKILIPFCLANRAL